MNDLEIKRYIKKELTRKRREIETMKNRGGKKKALKAYAELLTTLEIR